MVQLESTLKILRLVWMAFVGSIATFLVVLIVVDAASDVEPLIPLMLAFVAFTEVPILFVMRKQMLGTLALREPEDLRAEGRVDGDALEGALKGAAMRYQTGSIVSFALVESIVIMGFVASFMTGSWVWFGGHAGVALVLYFVLRPTRGGALSILTPQEREGVRQL